MKVSSNTVDKKQVEQAVDHVVKHIKQWTKAELAEIINQKKPRNQSPLIVELSANHFLVGNYAIKHYVDSWVLIYRYNDQELCFEYKNSAIFYAICQHRNRYDLSDQIMLYDQNINRLKREAEHFKQRIQRAKNRPMLTRELYTNRLTQVTVNLRHQHHLLEKTLKIAKYLNI